MRASAPAEQCTHPINAWERFVMGKRIAVLGTGAIGSSVGSDLTRAGEDVWLIDQWPAHVDAMKSKGLHIQMVDGDLHVPVRALHLCEVSALKQAFDIVFLTCKSPDSVWLAQFIKPYLASDGVLVSVQNSINDEWVAPIVGYERDVACVVELAAELWEPGIVKRHTGPTKAWFALGETHGRVTPRVQELVKILSVAGRTEVKPNIWGGKWSKLTVNSMSQAVSGILRISDWEIAQKPDLLELCIMLGRECLQVGTALGYQMEPIFGMTAEEMMGSSDETLKRTLLTLYSHIGQKSINSFLQDLIKGRPTEVHHMNGLVAAKGRAAGIRTPLNDEIVRVVEQIEAGQLGIGRDNLDRLEALVHAQRAG
jgi:2-dehydropantoate 2-reductase